MDVLIEIGKFVGLFILLFVTTVGIGGSIGIFFCWRGEKNAEREIKKHDAEVREKMRRHLN
ncbi:MAG: hypothetical protein IJ770_03130 [Alphaproteobacteria bacterium]|nr:hypothetical protein [Alphaproteobacteria bacterium]